MTRINFPSYDDQRRNIDHNIRDARMNATEAELESMNEQVSLTVARLKTGEIVTICDQDGSEVVVRRVSEGDK